MLRHFRHGLLNMLFDHGANEDWRALCYPLLEPVLGQQSTNRTKKPSSTSSILQSENAPNQKRLLGRTFRTAAGYRSATSVSVTDR